MFVNKEGTQKQSIRTRSSLTYSIPVSSLVCLEGGVLGFHKNGMEGRSLQTGKVEAEVRIYILYAVEMKWYNLEKFVEKLGFKLVFGI